MRLKELMEFQENYCTLERTKMTKKSLCDLVIPFRDKYGLDDGQALRVARREFPLKEIEKLMKKAQPTNGDKIRAMSDKELAGFLAGKFTDFSTYRKVDMGETPTATAVSAEAHLWFTAWMQWLRMPVEENENGDLVKRMSRV